MASHNIVYFTGYTHHKMGIQRNDKCPFCSNTVTTATFHLHKKQQTQMALDSKLSCEFL